MTKQRQLIKNIVISSKCHPTAEQVFLKAKTVMPSIVMATVYNNLNALTAAGEIRRVTVCGEADRYDNVEIPHEHLKCDKCGKISDIIIGDLFSELAERTGIQITSYELNLHYICGGCRVNDI